VTKAVLDKKVASATEVDSEIKVVWQVEVVAEAV
jgi:hypothetical protein